MGSLWLSVPHSPLSALGLAAQDSLKLCWGMPPTPPAHSKRVVSFSSANPACPTYSDVPNCPFLWIPPSLSFCLPFLPSAFSCLLSWALSLPGPSLSSHIPLPPWVFSCGGHADGSSAVSTPPQDSDLSGKSKCCGGSNWLQHPLPLIPRTSFRLHQAPRAVCSK